MTDTPRSRITSIASTQGPLMGAMKRPSEAPGNGEASGEASAPGAPQPGAPQPDPRPLPPGVPPQGAPRERMASFRPAAAAGADQSGLVVDRIGKTFRGRQVVKNVSLHLNRGEVAGLLGPNGAGKTTCFYMVTGLIAVDYGAIYLDGEDITAQPMYQRAREGLGYLPQETSIFRGMTVEQNVMAVVEMREKRRDKIRSITTELLEELHIAHLRASPAVALSGGERRRVEIARALASEPAFMLLDEPFAGIDPLAIADIREVVGYLKRRGIGILITDHNVRETLDIIDRCSIIAAGEVLFEGTPEEIVANPDVRRVYLGEHFE